MKMSFGSRRSAKYSWWRPLRILAVSAATASVVVGTTALAAAGPTAPYALVGPRGGALVILEPDAPTRLVPFAQGGQSFATAVAPDGLAYVADGANGRLDMLDLHSGKVIASVSMPRSPKALTVLTPDRRHVLTVGFGFARLYNASAPYNLEAVLPGNGGMAAVVMPNGRHAYVAGLNRAGIDVLDLQTHTLVTTLAPTQRFVSLALSTGGRRLYAFSPVSGDVLMFRTSDGHLLKTIQTAESGFNPKNPSTWHAGFMQATFSPRDGGTLFAAAFSGHVDRFQARTLSPLSPFTVSLNTGGPNQVVAVAVSPDGRRVFASDENAQGTVEFSVRTGRVIATFAAGTDSRWSVVPATAVAPVQGTGGAGR